MTLPSLGKTREAKAQSKIRLTESITRMQSFDFIEEKNLRCSWEQLQRTTQTIVALGVGIVQELVNKANLPDLITYNDFFTSKYNFLELIIVFRECIGGSRLHHVGDIFQTDFVVVRNLDQENAYQELILLVCKYCSSCLMGRYRHVMWCFHFWGVIAAKGVFHVL